MSGISSVEGTGSKRVLVLHGWALDSSIWDPARDRLDLDAYTYAFFDFPGYGSNRSAGPADGVDGMADAALAAAAEVSWDRFAILGHSMGGATALRVGTMAPERVVSICALTPVSPGGTPLDAETYEGFRAGWPEPGGLLHSLAPNLTDEQLAEIVTQSQTTLDKSVWDAYLANWTGADFLDELKACTMPAALVVGADDPFVTADYLDSTLSKLQAGKLVTIQGAGHYPMVEQVEHAVTTWETALA
jgi:pimeloyl-ACP methyl ester carboxylesterase